MDRSFSQPASAAGTQHTPSGRTLPMPADACEAFWRGLARRWARRVNFCWWLEKWLPLAITANILACLLFLLLRERAVPVLWGVAGWGVLLGLSGLLAWSVARPRFHTAQDALLRLDRFLNLRGALTTALEGKAPWPQARTLPLPPYRQRAGRSEYAALISISFLLAGIFIPLPTAEALPARAENPSPALEETLELVQELRPHDIVEPEPLDALERQAEALRERPQEDWYRQETLEAAEHLRAQTRSDLQQLGENLSEASSQVEAAADALQSGDVQSIQQLGEALEVTSRKLQMGKLPASSSLTERLQQLSRQMSAADQQQLMQALQQMDPSKLQQLAEHLRQQGGVCQSCAGLGKGPGQGYPGMEPGPEPSPGESESQSGQPGQGGIQRGPGEAPIHFINRDANLNPNDDVALNNEDFSQATFGDTLETSLTTPGPVDPDAFSLERGNGAGTGEAAAEAVWRNELTPQENRVLQDYFD
ncbi:MAG: hypothetical protein ACFBZ8_12645 [Opitutales bacterium]